MKRSSLRDLLFIIRNEEGRVGVYIYEHMYSFSFLIRMVFFFSFYGVCYFDSKVKAVRVCAGGMVYFGRCCGRFTLDDVVGGLFGLLRAG